jgi:DNA-binding NarL/FixJ family response regulator
MLNIKQMAWKGIMKMKVLVVDDSEPVGERILSMLSEIKNVQSIGRVASLNEAREVLPWLKPDLMILDIQLPDGNGMEFIKVVKATEHPTKIMVLTNHSLPIFRKKCEKLGADFFLDKAKDFPMISEICGSLASV